MFCKKCGFKLNENDRFCPFCGAEVTEKPTYGAYENLFESKEEKFDELRTSNGYVNLRTKAFHHLLIAGVGYFLMNVLAVIFATIGAAILTANGMDFSCIGIDGDHSTCAVGVYESYIKATAIAQLVAEILIVVIVIILFRKHIKTFFAQFKDKNTWKWIGIGFAIMYGFNFIYSNVLTLLNAMPETNANQAAVNEIIIGTPLLGFLFVVVAAPLFEETIFRFGVFRAFTQKDKKHEIIGMIITILVFAGVHLVATFESALMDPSNIDWTLIGNDMLTFPVYISGAFGITFAYYKSKNLATPITVHMCWNLMSFISNLLLPGVLG